MIEFKCGSCGSKLRASVEKAGRSGKCPKCGHNFQIPSLPIGQGPSEPGPGVGGQGGDDLDIQAWLAGATPTAVPPPEPAAPPAETQQVSPAGSVAPGGPARPQWGASAAPAISLRDIFRAPFSGDLAAAAVLQAGKVLLMGIAIVVCAMLAAYVAVFMGGVGKALVGGIKVAQVVMIVLMMVLLASLSRTYVAVAEQYASGRVMATTERSRMACLGIVLLVGLITWIPLVVLIGVGVAVNSTQAWINSPGVLVPVGLWCILYVPLGIVLAATEKTYNPVRVVRKAVQMWAGYLPVALYLLAFVAAAHVMGGLVQVVFSSLWLRSAGSLIGFAIGQYTFISGLGMTAMLLRKYKLTGGVSRGERRVAVPWILGVVAVGVAMGALRLAPFWTHDPITVSQHANRVKRLIGRMTNASLKKGATSAEEKTTRKEAAEELALVLPHRRHFFRDYLADLSDEDTQYTHRASVVLARVVKALPDGADLTPLLEIPTKQNEPLYTAAMKLVVDRADTEWLLEHSCADDENVRTFAAQVLADRLPSGDFHAAAVSQLAHPGSLTDKRARYEQLLAKTMDLFEQNLVGTHQCTITGVYEGATGRRRGTRLHPRGSDISVARHGETWEVTMPNRTWSGGIDALVKERFKLDVSVDNVGDFSLVVRCRSSGLVPSIYRSPVSYRSGPPRPPGRYPASDDESRRWSYDCEFVQTGGNP